MESGQMHAFDKTDTTIIQVVKDNIISVLQTVAYQDTIENIDRIDKFTELHSAEFLYGKAKRVMDQYATSAVCMFKITNIQDINDNFSRQMGNEIIAEVAKIVKAKMTNEYIFVRYMGPKFVIVFSGVEEVSVEQFLKDLKQEVEDLALVEDGIYEGEDDENIDYAYPTTNFVVSTYYKGTGIEQLTKRLEEYMDSAPKAESQINFV